MTTREGFHALPPIHNLKGTLNPKPQSPFKASPKPLKGTPNPLGEED